MKPVLTATGEPVEDATAVVPNDAMLLSETIQIVEQADGSIFDAEGCIPVHIIRPGVGKGKGRHVYEAAMLEENASKFTNWKMYVDHRSPEARKAAGGLPRSIRDLGGRIVESWWDNSVPADPERGFGQGAVVGRAKPVPFVKELIEHDPELVEASISASATGVKPVMVDGKKAWMVEGINPRGTVDWVTEAGAGGRVAPMLQHAYADPESMGIALLEAMSDEEIHERLGSRPGLQGPQGGRMKTKDGQATVTDDTDPKLNPDGTPVVEAEVTPEPTPEPKAEVEVTPEQISEALQQSAELQTFVSGIVEAKLTEEKSLIEASAEAKVGRAFQLSDLQTEAHKLISESRLPESWQGDLRERFSVKDQQPTPALDVVDQVDEDSGEVTKPAKDVLTEAVQAEITKERERLREASPTRVRGQGPVEVEETKDENGDPKPKPKHENKLWASVLSEAGVDPETAYQS